MRHSTLFSKRMLPSVPNPLRLVVLLSVIFLLPVSSIPRTNSCHGYTKHRVVHYDMTPEFFKTLPSRTNLDQGLSAVGDFNGDGSIDEAFFIEKDARYFLVVCLGGSVRLIKLLELERHPYRDEDGGDSVWSLPPGIYLSSCAKGYGCAPGDLGELELTHDGIQFTHGNTARVFYWDAGTFNVLWQGS